MTEYIRDEKKKEASGIVPTIMPEASEIISEKDEYLSATSGFFSGNNPWTNFSKRVWKQVYVSAFDESA